LKTIVSISLGSSARDHVAETEILGETFRIERRGTDGDLQRAVSLIEELDGKVDAFGMGGIDLYVHAGKDKRYIIRDALRLVRAAKITPMVDGGGVKDSWEYRVIEVLHNDYGLQFAGRTALVVQGVSRYGMSLGLLNAGAKVTFGDLAFTLGLPWPIRSIGTLNVVASIVAPVVARLPISMLYPTGAKQDVDQPKFPRLYAGNEFICGDFLYIKKHMPLDMSGKTLITNTVTAKDVELLRSRGVACLITTSPELNGRSFGANVLDAMVVAIAGRPPDQISEADYLEIIERMGLKPRVQDLQI